MQDTAPYASYVKDLEQAFKRGDATEHTYRSALETLFKHFDVVATNEPKRNKAGAPDYLISKNNVQLGYVEAKDIGVNLTKTEKTEQLRRYFDALNNLILTDYLEFRWYVSGELRLTAKVAEVKGKKLIFAADGADALAHLISAFLNEKTPTIKSPADLARKMAGIAQQIRYAISQVFNAEDAHNDEPNPLHEQFTSFKEVLISDLTPAQFADMYAQTITYGMFAARTSPSFTPPFDRYRASFYIPKTNPFLQTLFHAMAGPDLDESLNWIVDDLVNLLAHADIGAILQDFGKRTRQQDPVVHFYETFLAEYDPKMREARGVYYTPEPVVSYIVRSVDAILKRDFGLPDGLADTSRVRITQSDKEALKPTKTCTACRFLTQPQAQGRFCMGLLTRFIRR